MGALRPSVLDRRELLRRLGRSTMGLLLAIGAKRAHSDVIYGKISDINGNPVVSRPIRINGNELGRTDAQGYYQLNLPPGSYRLSVDGREVFIVVPPTGIKQDIKLPPNPPGGQQ